MTDNNETIDYPQGVHDVNGVAVMATPNVSLFRNLTSYTSKAVKIDEVVRMVKHDYDVNDKTEAYRKTLQAVGKKEADDRIKSKMIPACSIAVLFNGAGRQVEHILGFTGLAFVDLDGLKDVESALKQIVADPHTLMAYITIGCNGVRIIYRYTREQTDAHIDSNSWQAAFLKGNNHYATLTGKEFDGQCADYSHLCGLAHDENVYVNLNAEPFIITDKEILQANFRPGFEGGKPRKDYPVGTSKANIEEAWPKVKSMLEKKNLTFQPGHRHDFVMHASFLFNRFGVDLDELLEWAEEEWSDYDSKQCEATIRSCYKKTEEHGTWKMKKSGGKGDDKMVTLPEIAKWLKKLYDLKYDEVSDLTYCRQKGQTEWKTVDTRTICTIRRKIAEEFSKRILKSDVQDVIWSDESVLVHPVRDYINSLPKWDGKDRVTELASYVTVEPAQAEQSAEEAQQLFVDCFHKWHRANVGMWLDDKVANHEMLIFVGPQGIYKTTFFRSLLPPQLSHLYWENNHNNFKSKDDKIALGENCLVEVEEFNITKPDDVGEMKSLITALTIKERRPYARQREEKHRLAGFCGSCNEQHFLTDDTGNRRFLCFLISKIKHPTEWNIDLDQLYAQLREEFQRGDRYWFNHEEEQLLELQNNEFRLMSDEEMLVLTHFRKPRDNGEGEWMNSANIGQYINGGRLGYGLSTKKIGSVLTRRKFPFKHDSKGNFYLVVKIPPKQRQAEIAGNADNSEPEQKQPQQTELPF